MDELLKFPENDKRYGLTLIIRPDSDTKKSNDKVLFYVPKFKF